MKRSVRRPAWRCGTLSILLALLAGIALALSACGGDHTPAPAGPPQPVTPAAGDSTPSPYERLRLPVADALALAWSPDGSVLAVGDGPRIWLYDADLKPLRALEGHTAAVRDLAWSPDGTRLASAGLDNTVRVWNPATGATLATLGGHADWVFALDWSPDGTQLVSGGADNHVYLWDAGGGQPLTALGEAHVLALSFKLLDREVIQTVNTLEAALKTLAAIEAEPLADLGVRQALQLEHHECEALLLGEGQHDGGHMGEALAVERQRLHGGVHLLGGVAAFSHRPQPTVGRAPRRRAAWAAGPRFSRCLDRAHPPGLQRCG